MGIRPSHAWTRGYYLMTREVVAGEWRALFLVCRALSHQCTSKARMYGVKLLGD